MFGSCSQTGSGSVACEPLVKAHAEDAALVVAAQADPQAFTALYERYLGPVYRYCYLRMGNRDAAEDATSEVFLKALAGLRGYQGGIFAAWLFRIAHNTIADARRRHRPTEPIEDIGDPADPSSTPEEVVLARNEVEALRAALNILPEEQRVAVELQLAGWSGERAAAAMGKSVDAVKMLRYRAVSRLRTLLNDPGRGLGEGRDG
ncbi:MAG: RNA polymerase sigma factor [Sphingomonadaceae bacterium]